MQLLVKQPHLDMKIIAFMRLCFWEEFVGDVEQPRYTFGEYLLIKHLRIWFSELLQCSKRFYEGSDMNACSIFFTLMNFRSQNHLLKWSHIPQTPKLPKFKFKPMSMLDPLHDNSPMSPVNASQLLMEMNINLQGLRRKCR